MLCAGSLSLSGQFLALEDVNISFFSFSWRRLEPSATLHWGRDIHASITNFQKHSISLPNSHRRHHHNQSSLSLSLSLSQSSHRHCTDRFSYSLCKEALILHLSLHCLSISVLFNSGMLPIPLFSLSLNAFPSLFDFGRNSILHRLKKHTHSLLQFLFLLW